MSGWDETRRLALPDPWADFWVDLYENPVMAHWLAFSDAVETALADPVPDTIEQACRAMLPLVAAHNVTDRDGAPIDLGDFRSLAPSLFRAVVQTVQRAIEGEGTASPLAKGTSRRRSSRANGHRPGSPIGSSR